jgi:hypothetical protein
MSSDLVIGPAKILLKLTDWLCSPVSAKTI